MFYFSRPLTSFFKSPEIAPILRVLALGGIFSYVQQTTTGILQGLGRVHLPVLHSIIAAIIRIPILVYLTGLPQWGLRGTALAYTIGFIVMAVLNLMAISRHTGMPFDLQRFLLQPVTGGIGMLLIFHFLDPIFGGNLAGYLTEFSVGIALYSMILFFNGGVTLTDIKRLPWIEKYLPR